MQLMREVRYSLGYSAYPVLNSWAGGTSCTYGLVDFQVLRAWLEGEPDPLTGYICNIRTIDEIMRQRAIPLINQRSGERGIAEEMVLAIAEQLTHAAPARTRWIRWELCPAPYVRYAMNTSEPGIVEVTEAFEFSASHRLHVPALSEEENRRIFGKCNNPNGHGHNYHVEVTVSGAPDSRTGILISIHDLERIVKESVIDRFDHKHLNIDCPEFHARNPSVENITQVIWSLLENALPGVRLARVRVWETQKTYAEIAI